MTERSPAGTAFSQEAQPATAGAESADRPAQIRRLMLFFALVYAIEGVGQTDGLIAQPLNYFLKGSYGWSPVQVTAYLTVLNLPWIIKPLYGVVFDFIPLFGYRRKAYLILANAAAAGAYFWMTRLAAPGGLIVVLLLTAYAMAVASTLCGAVLVENGQRFGNSDVFVNQQWLWFNIAAMASALLGGALVEHLPPESALHTAAAVIAVAPLAGVVGSALLIGEQQSPLDLGQLKATLRGFLSTFGRRELWLIAVFLFLYYFNPGLATPLYYYMTDNLKFSQQFIGVLGAVNSAGWIAGALFHRSVLGGLSARALLQLSIALGATTTAAFLLLDGEASAVLLNFASGVAGMIAFVATLTLAADYCPKRSEGFAFAALMSVTNLSAALSDNVGSFLYERAFANRLAPLIIVSAAFTVLALLFIPLLRLGDKRPGEPARGAAGHDPGTVPAGKLSQ
ncbi:MAG: MFS transporter [Alphaproteobacteria bacterium]|nr:MFS transporter [Alphaproteobacteria bacterium]